MKTVFWVSDFMSVNRWFGEGRCWDRVSLYNLTGFELTAILLPLLPACWYCRNGHHPHQQVIFKGTDTLKEKKYPGAESWVWRHLSFLSHFSFPVAETEKHVTVLSVGRRFCQAKEPQRKSQDRQGGRSLRAASSAHGPDMSQHHSLGCCLSPNTLILGVIDPVPWAILFQACVFNSVALIV